MHLNGIEMMRKENEKVTVVRAGAAVAECTKKGQERQKKRQEKRPVVFLLIDFSRKHVTGTGPPTFKTNHTV